MAKIFTQPKPKKKNTNQFNRSRALLWAVPTIGFNADDSDSDADEAADNSGASDPGSASV